MSVGRCRDVVAGIWQVGCGSWTGRTEILSVEGSANVWLVGGPEGFALVDAGTTAGVAAVIGNAAAVGAGPGRIAWILLTHSHDDHMEGAAELAAAAGAELAAPYLTALACGGDARAIDTLLFRISRPPAVSRRLVDGDMVDAGTLRITALSTPGHMPDCMTFVAVVDGRTALFTGDTAIGDQAGMQGVVGWLDGHWHSNPRQLLRSLRKLADLDADVLLPGHGHPIVGKESVRLSLVHCRERVEMLLAIPDLGSMMPLDLEE